MRLFGWAIIQHQAPLPLGSKAWLEIRTYTHSGKAMGRQAEDRREISEESNSASTLILDFQPAEA